MPADRPDLQALVENPREALEVEIKDWMDLTDKFVRADIARHIAALANHGGGHLIFGFEDQSLQPNPNGPSSLDSFSRDEISSIVKRYLVPTFQCEVYHIESTATKIVHPVIWVPSHGAVPICTKADGPADEHGKHHCIRHRDLLHPFYRTRKRSHPDARCLAVTDTSMRATRKRDATQCNKFAH